MRATKRVRYTAREMRVRFFRYKEVNSLMSDLIEALERRCFGQGLDRTAIATVGEAFVVYPCQVQPYARCSQCVE